MTDSMLWLNGSTVLSTVTRSITNELLRSQGVCVIEVPQQYMQQIWQNSQSAMPTLDVELPVESR